MILCWMNERYTLMYNEFSLFGPRWDTRWDVDSFKFVMGGPVSRIFWYVDPFFLTISHDVILLNWWHIPSAYESCNVLPTTTSSKEVTILILDALWNGRCHALDYKACGFYLVCFSCSRISIFYTLDSHNEPCVT